MFVSVVWLNGEILYITNVKGRFLPKANATSLKIINFGHFGSSRLLQVL